MNNHLTAEQITSAAIGEVGADVQRHLTDCDACRCQVARLTETLGGFRTAVHQFSAECLPPFVPSLPRSRVVRMRWYGALAFCTLCLLIGLIIPKREPGVIQQESPSGISDGELMLTIDQEISRTVPDSMEPLAGLIAWDSTTPAEPPAQPSRIR